MSSLSGVIYFSDAWCRIYQEASWSQFFARTPALCFWGTHHWMHALFVILTVIFYCFYLQVSPSQTTPLFAENYCVTPAFEPCNAFLMNILSDDFVLPDRKRWFDLHWRMLWWYDARSCSIAAIWTYQCSQLQDPDHPGPPSRSTGIMASYV